MRKVYGKGKAVAVLKSHAVQTCRKVEVEIREFLTKVLGTQLSEEHHTHRFSPSTYRTESRDSSVGIPTRYGLDGPGIESRWEARFSAPVQTDPGAHPASYTMGTGSFPGVKRPERGVDHPPPSSAKVKERVELYLYSPSGPSWPVIGRTLPLPLPL